MDLTVLFCDVDDFVKQHNKQSLLKLENNGQEKKKYYRANKLSDSEM